MLVVDGADAQTKAAHSAAGLPACSHSGAADSDECVTFEQILAGICGDRDAAVAAEELEANQITELESASQPSLTRIPEDVHADVSFDTTVGPPSAHYSGREPLVESVFFSDSDADWDQGRRHSKQTAGTPVTLIFTACTFTHTVRSSLLFMSRSTAEDGPKRRPGSKAAPHGPLPQVCCPSLVLIAGPPASCMHAVLPRHARLRWCMSRTRVSFALDLATGMLSLGSPPCICKKFDRATGLEVCLAGSQGKQAWPCQGASGVLPCPAAAAPSTIGICEFCRGCCQSCRSTCIPLTCY